MLALPALILIPLLGGVFAWLSGAKGPLRLTRLISIATLLLMGFTLVLLTLLPVQLGPWRAHFAAPWVPSLGIAFRLDLDGLGLIMLWLNFVIALPCVLLPGRTETDGGKLGPGRYHGLIWATIAGVNGVFLATDLFLFFAFWELMLLPIFVLILIRGHAHRGRAAVKFFMFTQGGGLLMLLAILALVLTHARATGVLTFDYFALGPLAASAALSPAIALGFLAAFAVKLPLAPFHVWLPDTYVEAPIPASILLSGILAKTGGFGLIRFVALFFPLQSAWLAPAIMVLGTFGILYCAWLAAAQDDVKRLIAYSSISHLGFVALGVFSGTTIGLEGAIIQMVAHGLSTGALFVIAGVIEERCGTRDMTRLGGLWAGAPVFSALTLIFVCASLGLPGLGNFVGEFLVLLGTWQTSHAIATFAALGLALSSVYSLTMMTRIFFGPAVPGVALPTLGRPSLAILAGAAVLLLVLGLHPQPVLDASRPGLPLQGTLSPVAQARPNGALVLAEPGREIGIARGLIGGDAR